MMRFRERLTIGRATRVRYVRAVTWLAVDASRRSRLDTIKVAALNALGVTAYAFAFATVLMFVRALQEGKSPLPFVSLPGEGSPAAVLLFSSAFIVLATFGAVSRYRGSTIAQRIARRYEAYATGRLLEVLATRVDFGGGRESKRTMRSIQRLAMMGARDCGRSYLSIVESVIALCKLCVGVGILLWLSAALSAIVLLLLGLYASIFVWFSRRVVRTNRSLQQLATEANFELQQVLQRVVNVRLPADCHAESFYELSETGKNRIYRDAFDGRLLAGVRSAFLNDLFLALCMAGILAGFAAISTGAASLTMLLTFVVMLRFTGQNLRLFTSELTKLHRFYPRMSDYFDFIDQYGGTTQPGEPGEESAGAEWRMRPQRLPEVKTPIRTGDVLALFTPRPVNRFGVAALLRMIAGGKRQPIAADSVFFCGRGTGHLAGTVRENLQGTAAAREDVARLEELLEQLEVRESFARLPNGLDSRMSADLNKQFDADMRLVFSLMPGLLRAYRVFLLDGGGFQACSVQFRERLRAVLSDRLLVLSFAQFGGLAGLPEFAKVALADDRNVLECGDLGWFRENQARLQADFQKILTTCQSDGTEVGGLEMDDPDELLDAA